jgi:hypothetical protein
VVRYSITSLQNPSKRTDIVAAPSGSEIILLQKVDSLLVFECKKKLKRFLRSAIRGIREKNLQKTGSMNQRTE